MNIQKIFSAFQSVIESMPSTILMYPEILLIFLCVFVLVILAARSSHRIVRTVLLCLHIILLTLAAFIFTYESISYEEYVERSSIFNLSVVILLQQSFIIARIIIEEIVNEYIKEKKKVVVKSFDRI